MSEQDPPKIEFPCDDYPVKIMGEHSESFQLAALDVVEKYAPGFDRDRIGVRVSSKGSFRSITVFITATGVDQLQALHQDLMAMSETKMVL
jgi:putative lipoic acid-binding regulatory protein